MNQKIVTMMESPVSTSRNFLKLGACSVQHTSVVFSVVCRFRITYGAALTPPVLKRYSSFNNCTILVVVYQVKKRRFLCFLFFSTFLPFSHFMSIVFYERTTSWTQNNIGESIINYSNNQLFILFDSYPISCCTICSFDYNSSFYFNN